MFKKQYIIAINISDSSIEVLQLNGNREVLAFGKVALEAGIIEKGIIANKEKLAQKIKELLKNTKPKSLEPTSYKLKAILNLPESQVFINESKKNIPFDLDNVYLDSIEKESKPTLYIAASKKVVEDYISVVKMAGVEPVVLDIQSLSLGRVLLSDRRHVKSKGSVMIFHINSGSLNLSFFNTGSELKMSVSINIDGNKLNIEEIKDAISFYKNKYGEEIQEIILVAKSEILPKIREYLSPNLTGALITANPLEGIKNAEVMSRESDQSLLASVIGLALRASGTPSEGVNLLPEAINVESRNRHIKVLVIKISDIIEDLRRSMKFGVAFVVLALIFLGFVMYFYILKAPEKLIQKMPSETPSMESEPKIIIPETSPIPVSTSTDFRSFRELLEEEDLSTSTEIHK